MNTGNQEPQLRISSYCGSNACIGVVEWQLPVAKKEVQISSYCGTNACVGIATSQTRGGDRLYALADHLDGRIVGAFEVSSAALMSFLDAVKTDSLRPAE